MENRSTGVYVDLDKDFYKTVKKFCVNKEFKIKEFVKKWLLEGMKNDKRIK